VFVDSAHTASNFGKLRIRTSPSHTDTQQMRAAGWMEGYLTAGVLVRWHLANVLLLLLLLLLL
jgi:hypothetical protein